MKVEISADFVEMVVIKKPEGFEDRVEEDFNELFDEIIDSGEAIYHNYVPVMDSKTVISAVDKDVELEESFVEFAEELVPEDDEEDYIFIFIGGKGVGEFDIPEGDCAIQYNTLDIDGSSYINEFMLKGETLEVDVVSSETSYSGYGYL